MDKNRCKSCSSCGFPMEKPEDFAQSNVISIYCSHCTNERGELLPFETILAANIRYYMDSQGIAEAAAKTMAINLLANMPAWKNRKLNLEGK
jgi:hypothetical protein